MPREPRFCPYNSHLSLRISFPRDVLLPLVPQIACLLLILELGYQIMRHGLLLQSKLVIIFILVFAIAFQRDFLQL